MSDASAPVPDRHLAAALAADLDAADFRSEPLRRMWGEEADDALGRGLRHPILQALGADAGALAILGRLFVLGMTQPLDAVAAAVPRCGVDGLAALGIVRLDGDAVAPTALLRPQSFVDADGIGEWWIASDLDEVALGAELPADHVLGVGGATRTLAELVMPTPVERALDLGTGCGIQALLVSRHAGQVVATDISRRALAFAELNAQLNGVSNIVFRHGSLFEPVAGEAFDLIVSNPPFVITPRAQGVPDYEYRDGGLVGDALVEEFVRTATAHLTPGGAAQLLGNWESWGSVAGLDRVRSWIPADVDAWVVEREELSPLAYAELWIRDGGTLPRDAAFSTLLGAWLDDFAAREVTAVGFGYILLRRPPSIPVEAQPPAEESDPASTFRRFERVPQPLHDAGRAFAAGIAASDLLRSGLPETLVVASDVTEARHFLPGSDDPSVIELRQGGGFGRTISVDPALAGFVGACDGELTVWQIAAALADLFEVPLADLWADLEPRIRQLVIDGFLLPGGVRAVRRPPARPGSVKAEVSMTERLRVAIAAPLEPELCELLVAREPRIDLVVEQELLLPPQMPGDSFGDSSHRRTEEQQARFEALLDTADALFGVPDQRPKALARVVRANPRLRWVHTIPAGGGAQVKAAELTAEELERVRFTTSAGVHGEPLAEFALFGVLAGAKTLPRLIDQQRRKEWPARWQMGQVSDQTVLILGVGGIGRALAPKLAALGATVIGTSRSGATVPGVHRTVHPDDLAQVLPEVDAVVVTLPGTDATFHLVGAEFFAALRPGATIVNVGRGTVIDEAALLEALESDAVGFAALDVTEVEPLPADSPLWEHPRVLLSPHTAATTRGESRRIAELFAANATRLLDGEELVNVVDTVEFY